MRMAQRKKQAAKSYNEKSVKAHNKQASANKEGGVQIQVNFGVGVRVPVTRQEAERSLHQYRSGARLTEAGRKVFLESGNRFQAPQPPSFDESECPNCQYCLTENQIIAGFRDDNLDFTTECPVCEERFITTATLKVVGEIATFPCLCRNQTKDQCDFFFEKQKILDAGDEEKVERLAELRPDLAWNAYWHGRTRSNEGVESDSVSDIIQFFLFGTVKDIFESGPDFVPVNSLDVPSEPSDLDADIFSMEMDIDPPVIIKNEVDEDEDEDVILFDDEPVYVPVKKEKKEKKKEKKSRTELPKVGKQERSNKISKAAVKRISVQAGARRISKKSSTEIQNITDDFLVDLIGKSALLMQHRRGKMLQPKDTELVAQILRNNRRGFF